MPTARSGDRRLVQVLVPTREVALMQAETAPSPTAGAPAADPAAPPTEGLADAARHTHPEAGKGRSEHGEAPDGGA